MKKDKIRIAGAGISGLTAAISLSRMGYPVEVFEKNGDSGFERTSDWDAIENWTTREDFRELIKSWGIENTFELACPEIIEVFDTSESAYTINSCRPMIYLVRRGTQVGSLDQCLKEQALECGVEIVYGQVCSQDEVDIWAAGTAKNGFFLNVGVTFRTNHTDTLAYLVSPQAAPKAYAYLAIVNGIGKITVFLTQEYQAARQYLMTAMDTFHRLKDVEMEDVQVTSGFGGLPDRIGAQEKRSIAVGEAAGFHDFFTGFGVRFAMLSGYLAALAINKREDYSMETRRDLSPLVRTSLVHRMLYDLMGERFTGRFLQKYADSSKPFETLGQWYRGSALERLLWPLARRQYQYRRVYVDE